MMPGKSPPKHRHDGTSPLPVGMDWSPPPRKWNGRDTVWPHDFRTGWSYCVTIPSWVVLPKSRNSDPVVFYRVQIGIQSPEGKTTTRGVLRRFNDFLNLFAGLKKALPKKNLPAAPPKGLLRMKSRTLLEERRCSLELWMAKLLSDIDVSRSFIVASFLELEAAARSSFQDVDEQTSERSPASSSSTSSSSQLHPNSNLSVTLNKSSIASDYGSDTAYETSDLGTPRLGRDTGSEIGTEDLTLDEDLTNPIEKLVQYGISNIDEGLFVGQTILDELEDFPLHRVHARQVSSLTGKDMDNGTVPKATFRSSVDSTENMSDPEHGKVIGHARKLSTDSVGSDVISLKSSEISNSGISNSVGEGSLDYHGGAEVMDNIGNKELQFAGDTQIVLPLDQRHKLNRVLMTMHRRLVTAKTDMEDLIARLNQEIAVKDYLATKVKDLEVELETTKQKSKENLQQAILVERERVTRMQWDMEELRRKSLEMELKLKSEKEGVGSEPTEVCAGQETETLMKELEATKDQLQHVLNRHEELQVKSKSDIKVLVKEVKSLRSSQADLKQQLNQSLKEKIDTERLLLEEKQRSENAKSARRRLLHECMILRNQLQECDIDILPEDEDKIVSLSSSMEALDILTTSENQIGCIVAGAQLLAEEENSQRPLVQDNDKSAINGKFLEFNGDAAIPDRDDDDDDEEMRNMLKLVLMDNARLRKQVSSVTRRALKKNAASTKEDAEPPPTKTIPS